MERKKIKIGLFGFGCVGKGLYDVLGRTPGLNADIVKICVKDKMKSRPIASHNFTFDRNELLYNKDVNVIVELIDDSEEAFLIVSEAMKMGKSVVTANKKMIAEHLPELLLLQKKHGVALLYEAACCASIPIIRNLEEYYDNDLLNAVKGIFNGSTNYILTKIFNEDKSYHLALSEAKQLGFAESNPILDVAGFDAKFKLVILLAHAFGLVVDPERIPNFGINRLNDFDICFAREKGYTIKLIAQCRKLGESVHAAVYPQFVKNDHKLSSVNEEYNGVIIESVFADKQFFVGKGAGSFPTASAVLSDISALTYDYRYEYKKIHQNLNLSLETASFVEIYLRYPKNMKINIGDFDKIFECYQSGNYCYITGSIKESILNKSEWTFDPEVNFIILPENERDKNQNFVNKSKIKISEEVLAI